MIPDYEINVLLLAEVEAMDLARDGRVVEGYDCLLSCLDRVREDHALDEEWAEALIQQYEAALIRYSERYGVRLN